MQQSTSDLRIVLIGKTGQGKSTLGNKILGVDHEVFKVGHSLRSETVIPSSKTFTWPYNQNLKVDLVDTPGLADNSGKEGLSDEKILEKLEEYVKGLKKGFNMALFCWHGRQRFDRTDLDELQMIGDMLTAKVFHNIWICVTQLDDMKPEGRDKLVNNVRKQLPELFADNGIDIPAENLLVSDFEDFENSMMKPIDKILKTSTFYKMPEEKSYQSHPIYQGILSRIKLWEKDEAELLQDLNNPRLSIASKGKKEVILQGKRSQISQLKVYLKNPCIYMDYGVDNSILGRLEFSLFEHKLPKIVQQFKTLCKNKEALKNVSLTNYDEGHLSPNIPNFKNCKHDAEFPYVHKPGTISMFVRDDDVLTFFISRSFFSHFDGRYCVFGHLIGSQSLPKQNVKILDCGLSWDTNNL